MKYLFGLLLIILLYPILLLLTPCSYLEPYKVASIKHLNSDCTEYRIIPSNSKWSITPIFFIRSKSTFKIGDTIQLSKQETK